jgi:UDP-N-acetylmuramyl pentapeptide phosphotransferase/UDP-N-acetylglucosamine-1-phosphate transferase
MMGDGQAWSILGWSGPLLFVAAVAATAIVIMLVRPLLARYALARPNARSSHTKPTPQGGGIAVVAAMLLLTALAVAANPALGRTALTELAPLFAAMILLALVGAFDDIRPIAVVPRLLLQCIAVLAVIAVLPTELRLVPWSPLWLERILLVVAGLWFVNLVNFMDGIDWMTVAELVPVSGALVILGLMGALPPTATLLAFALLGAMLGFAPFNRPVAGLFLGDVGSLPLGLVTGWLLVQLAGAGHLAAALLLPLYYLADATLTLLRRLLRGEPVMQAHRTHFYQRARERGFSVMHVVGRVFALNLALAALAIATATINSMPAGALACAIGAGLVAWLLAIFARGRK